MTLKELDEYILTAVDEEEIENEIEEFENFPHENSQGAGTIKELRSGTQTARKSAKSSNCPTGNKCNRKYMTV